MVRSTVLLLAQASRFFPGTGRTVVNALHQAYHVCSHLLFRWHSRRAVLNMGHFQHYLKFLRLPTELI